jgi:acyl-CoA synthetase (AMP-forming)/AMP-acid ligase II
LLPNQEAKLLDIDDPDVEISSRGRAGEICIRGPNVFKGYHNDLPATEAALTSDGYFRTGDVGIIDEAGHLRVVDRIKELIKFKGYQVAPAELEGILLRHKGVADACVVGVYDEKQRTELPRAYVVRNKAWLPSDQKGCSPDEALALELQDWVAQRAAHYKRLRGGVLFVDELPRTASGKILRRHLKEAKEKARL